MKDPDPDRSADGRSRHLIEGLDESLSHLRDLRDMTRKKALTISISIAAATVLLSACAFVINGDFLAFVLVPGLIVAVVSLGLFIWWHRTRKTA